MPSIPAPSVKWCIVRHPVWSSAHAQLHCCPYLSSEVSTYHSLLRDPLSPLWLLPKGFYIIIAYFRWAQGGPDWNTILAGSPCRDGKVNQTPATTTIQSCSTKLFHHHGHCLFQSTRHYHHPKLLHQAVPPPWPLLATKPSVTPCDKYPPVASQVTVMFVKLRFGAVGRGAVRRFSPSQDLK